MTDNDLNKLKPFIDGAKIINKAMEQSAAMSDPKLKNSPILNLSIMNPKIQKAINKLSKTPAFSPIEFPEKLGINPKLPELDTNLETLLIENRKRQREAQAQAIAEAMSEILKEVLETQNQKAESNIKQEHRFLKWQTFWTIIGSGICAAATTLFTNWLMS